MANCVNITESGIGFFHHFSRTMDLGFRQGTNSSVRDKTIWIRDAVRDSNFVAVYRSELDEGKGHIINMHFISIHDKKNE